MLKNLFQKYYFVAFSFFLVVPAGVYASYSDPFYGYNFWSSGLPILIVLLLTFFAGALFDKESIVKVHLPVFITVFIAIPSLWILLTGLSAAELMDFLTFLGLLLLLSIIFLIITILASWAMSFVSKINNIQKKIKSLTYRKKVLGILFIYFFPLFFIFIAGAIFNVLNYYVTPELGGDTSLFIEIVQFIVFLLVPTYILRLSIGSLLRSADKHKGEPKNNSSFSERKV